MQRETDDELGSSDGQRPRLIALACVFMVLITGTVVLVCWGGYSPVGKDVGQAAVSSIPDSLAEEAAPQQEGRFQSKPTEHEQDASVVQREDVPARLLSFSQLSYEDRGRLDRVNDILLAANKPPISRDWHIADDDLAVFQEIVDVNERRTQEAERMLTKRALALLMKKRKAVAGQIAAGITEGLPLRGPNNELKRRHPFEAISLQIIAGKECVLRVPPSEDPELASLGEQYGSQCKSHVADLDTLVRGLFCPEK